jgi:hypothetical protein
MSEVRGDDALGGVPFNVSNPAFASGAGSTQVRPPAPAEEPEAELEVPAEQTEVEAGSGETPGLPDPTQGDLDESVPVDEPAPGNDVEEDAEEDAADVPGGEA